MKCEPQSCLFFITSASILFIYLKLINLHFYSIDYIYT